MEANIHKQTHTDWLAASDMPPEYYELYIQILTM